MLIEKVLNESIQKQNVLKQKSIFKCRKAFLNRVKTENAKSCLVKTNNFKLLCQVILFISHSQNSMDAKTSADSFNKVPWGPCMQALLFFLQAHNLCLGFVEFYAKLAGKFEFEKRDIFKCPRTFCHRKTQIQNNCRFLNLHLHFFLDISICGAPQCL